MNNGMNHAQAYYKQWYEPYTGVLWTMVWTMHRCTMNNGMNHAHVYYEQWYVDAHMYYEQWYEPCTYVLWTMVCRCTCVLWTMVWTMHMCTMNNGMYMHRCPMNNGLNHAQVYWSYTMIKPFLVGYYVPLVSTFTLNKRISARSIWSIHSMGPCTNISCNTPINFRYVSVPSLDVGASNTCCTTSINNLDSIQFSATSY